MSLPTSPISPLTAKDLRGVARRTPTPHKGAYVKREDIEAVFLRCGLRNPENGTWNNRLITLHLPKNVDRIPRGQAKVLMEQARENRTNSQTHPLRDRSNLFSPKGRYKRTPDHR